MELGPEIMVCAPAASNAKIWKQRQVSEPSEICKRSVKHATHLSLIQGTWADSCFLQIEWLINLIATVENRPGMLRPYDKNLVKPCRNYL